jgi:hypothetical protein
LLELGPAGGVDDDEDDRAEEDDRAGDRDRDRATAATADLQPAEDPRAAVAVQRGAT